MGNALLDETKKQDPVQIYQQWLQQNPDLVSREVLTHNKLFQTSSFKYCQSSIKMQVFFRRDSTPLQEYLRAFQIIQGLVERYKCMHILPMRILELKQFKDKDLQKYQQNFTVAVRQYLHMTLQQKLEGRPRLSQQQKIWIIYQAIFAIYTIHQIFNIYHGNIRTSNFLITAYHYLILTDFASYKPNYILQDTEQGLAQFRLFYSSSVQKCTLACEKLAGRDNLPSTVTNSKRLFNISQSQEDRSTMDGSRANVDASRLNMDGSRSNMDGSRSNADSSRSNADSSRSNVDSAKKIKKNAMNEDSQGQKQINKLKMMDMFSLGLTILQIINDGKAVLTYEQLLKLKKEGFNLTDKINQAASKINTGKDMIVEIVTGLLKENPQERFTITQVLQKYVTLVNLETNALFWCCLSAFNKTSFSSCDLRVHLFIQAEIRQTAYKFTQKPPRCLEGFKSLKIFVEMIEKKTIFSPKVDDSAIFQKLMNHFDKVQEHQVQSEKEEESLFEDEDERRKFFINPSKKGTIAKRLSFVQGIRPKEKDLCPPNYSEIEHLIDLKHKPIKLTQLGLKSSRLEELLKEYKLNQWIREQRLKHVKYYINCEIIIKIIFSCLRNCKYVASKLLAIEMISFFGRDCTDSVLLKVMLPYWIQLCQDADLNVARSAFFALLNVFYDLIDPFHNEQDMHYFEIIIQFFIGLIKQSKLRLTLFSHFKQVYQICEWLQIHFKRFGKPPKVPLTKVIEVIKVNYGSYSRQQIKVLLSNNIPQHILPDMFEFYISIINTDRLQGLKLSLNLAHSISPATHKHILDAFDSCIESGLQQYGMGLFYSIQYFTLRKSTSHYIIRKIAPHVVNPSKWIRDEALSFVRMCLEEYPPTKSYFFFKDIFDAPFPLKPQDIEDQVLLPAPLKDSQIDLKDKKLKIQPINLTQSLFNDYLKTMKSAKTNDKSSDRIREQQVSIWNSQTRKLLQTRQGRILNFQLYIKRQLQLLYEYNLLYYILNMNNKFNIGDKQKIQEKGYPELIQTLKKIGRFPMDLSSIDHEKKELFEQFQGTVNSTFQKLIAKKSKQNGEVVTDKLKLAQSILTIGQVLCKFQMFKIKPIPKLGSYIRQPTLSQKLPRPRGILVSEIFQHSDSVTCLEKVADQFFLSGSSDGTLRIFDSKKIQINITTSSEALLEIKGEGEEKVKITSICSFDQTFTAVVGSNKGHIRVYPIERLSGNKGSRTDQIIKYTANGQLQKIITFQNQLKNQCFCYITAQGNLGIQDIRLKSKSMGCNIGRQRGIPRSLCSTSRNSILIGTIDGYVINFDIRYNVISSVLQLRNDGATLPITGIYPCPLQVDQKEQLYALTYPSKCYEFSCFNMMENRAEFGPEKQYSSSTTDQILATPYLTNLTSQEQFKLCRNGLIWRKTYDQLSDFHKNFNIFDYLSDPLTRKEAKIRQVWLQNCKNRYNQISSLYNRKSLPFLQFLGSGILTNCNPSHSSVSETRGKTPLSLLTQKRQNKDYNDIQRIISTRPNTSHKVITFSGQQNKDYYTCCRVLPNMAIVGCRNSMIKIYI